MFVEESDEKIINPKDKEMIEQAKIDQELFSRSKRKISSQNTGNISDLENV